MRYIFRGTAEECIVTSLLFASLIFTKFFTSRLLSIETTKERDALLQKIQKSGRSRYVNRYSYFKKT